MGVLVRVNPLRADPLGIGRGDCRVDVHGGVKGLLGVHRRVIRLCFVLRLCDREYLLMGTLCV